MDELRIRNPNTQELRYSVKGFHVTDERKKEHVFIEGIDLCANCGEPRTTKRKCKDIENE